MRKYLAYLAVAVFTWFCVGPAAAAPIQELRINQVTVAYPSVKVYGNLTDNDGQAVDSDKADRFKATIGSKAVPVRTAKPFGESGEGIGYILLVDVSASLQAKEAQTVKEALRSLVDGMTAADSAAVMTFGTNIETVQDFTGSKDTLNRVIAHLAFHDDKTQLYRALIKAADLGRRKNAAAPPRRVIIVISDGQDDFIGSVTKDEVFQSMKEDRIPVYTIGVSSFASPAKREEYYKILGEFARTSGGKFFSADTTPIVEVCRLAQRYIRQAFVLDIDIAGLEAEGNLYRLQVRYDDGRFSAADGLEFRLWGAGEAGVAGKVKEWLREKPLFTGAGSLAVLFVVIILLLGLRRKSKTKARQEIPAAPSASERPLEVHVDVWEPHVDKPLVERNGLTGLSIRLTVIKGKAKAQVLPVTGAIIIGRDADNDFVLADDLRVSGRHCRLFAHDGKIFIEDLRSTNHTFVNGASVTTRQVIADGDIIRVGNSELRLSILGKPAKL